MTIKLTVGAGVRGSVTETGAGGVATLPINIAKNLSLTNGTGASQANAVFVDEFNIAASASSTFDLAGSLVDRLGNALVFASVKAVFLIADATNTNNVIFGNATNPFAGPLSAGTTTITVKPGGVMLVSDPSAAGWAVGAGTADEIKIENSGAGTAVTGTLVVIGEV